MPFSHRRYAIGRSVTRRDIIRLGGMGLVAMGLPCSLKLGGAAAAPVHTAKTGSATAERFLFVFLRGGPSHIDLWDPKPDAPLHVRGEFKPIKTSAPGIEVSEVLPKLARVMNRATLIRSCSYSPAGVFHHDAAIYELLTGHPPEKCAVSGQLEERSVGDGPTVVANIARALRSDLDTTPYALLPSAVQGINGVDNCTADGWHDFGFSPNSTSMDLSVPYPFSGLKELSLHDCSSNATRGALRISEETDKIQEAYGRNTFGASLLAARRSLEAGSRVVQVNWTTSAKHDAHATSFDTHRNNFESLRNVLGPRLDVGLSALLDDMDSRGLLSETIVLVMGEFGRSPKLGISTSGNANSLDGRDHWPYCFTALMAGGGITRGAVYGQSDATGAYPAEKAVHPAQLLATVCHALGIPASTALTDQEEGVKAKRLVIGEPILELLG